MNYYVWHLDKFENIQAFSVCEEEAREEQKLHLFFNLEQKRHEEDNELQLFTSGVITFWPISDYSLSTTSQNTRYNPREAHFNKQTSGLFKDKVPY